MNGPHEAIVEATVLLRRALVGEAAALDRLIAHLTPIIMRRVIRALVKAGRPQAARDGDLVRDLTQDVFVDLFANEAKILKDWQPERGASLENFVGLVAARRTSRRLERTRYATAETFAESLDPNERPSMAADPEQAAVARNLWHDLLGQLEDRLSPTGWQMFLLLFVEERSQAEIEAETGLGRDAVYAWRSRLRKLVRELGEASEAPIPRTEARVEARHLVEVGGG